MLKKLSILFVITPLISLLSFSNASVTRLYVGELDGQFMAGVDTRIEFSIFYIGGDVRTLIRKTVVNEDERVVGFFPDRSDYKTFIGLSVGNFEMEYAHTCYHRVISEENLQFYEGSENLADTDTLTLRWFF